MTERKTKRKKRKDTQRDTPSVRQTDRQARYMEGESKGIMDQPQGMPTSSIHCLTSLISEGLGEPRAKGRA